MSNYTAPTRHPVTGAIEMADWLDDHDGKHRYGVRFPSDGKIYGGHECVEVRPREMMAEIERLREKIKNIIEWCDKLISHKPIPKPFADAIRDARAALEGKKTNDDATLGDQTWGRER
jgi:hypothetical protein